MINKATLLGRIGKKDYKEKPTLEKREENPELTPIDLFFLGTMKDKQYMEENTIELEEYVKKKEKSK